MEHVVFFPAHDGTPAFRRVAGLEDAVRLVEHLRNVEGVNEVSVASLTEVPLAFRTVIKVDFPLVPAQAEPEAAPVAAVAPEPQPEPVAEVAPEPDAVPEVAPVPEPVMAVVDVPVLEAAPEPALASSNGRSADGAKSLGFFA